MKSFILLALLCTACTISGQEKEEVIRKELNFTQQSADNLLVIENIFGNIEVNGYDGNTIQLEVTKKISAKNPKQVDIGWEEVTLGIIEKQDFIVVYMKTPCTNDDALILNREDLDKGWRYNWGDGCKWQPDYDMRFDYKVRVPRNLNVQVSTINEGEVSVSKVEGAVKANNINGGITLEGLAGPTNVCTINGDVNIVYRTNPAEASRYYTLNGDINATYQPGLSANVFFKSQYGDLFTDIDEITKMPTIIEKEEVDGEVGISYKIGAHSGIKVRNGGPKLEFETFNGDVFVKEQ
jgi:DUF4097 and DUF4098 domain-containing protein YvlB